MLNKYKKQIVFIEPLPNVFMYRLARSLRLTGKYETILFSFSKVDKEFFNNAYDKIFVLELSHKLKIKNLFDFSKKMLNGKVKTFLEQIKKMEPYLFHVTGPDLFSLMTLSFLGKNPAPKVYYSNDLWSSDTRNFFFTRNFWIRGEFQKFCEKMCFRLANGALNKMSLEDFDFLKYKVNLPKMALPPGCLDEWIFPPQKKKNKDIHIVFGGSPNTLGGEKISFIGVIKVLTSQKIFFHTYGPCPNKKDDEKFNEESKKNQYYVNHEKINADIFNKELSSYNYGILVDFLKPSEVNSNPGLIEGHLCSKMINYIEAGLPIIVNRQFKYMAEIVEKNNIGFGIDVRDLQNLKKIIKQKDYSQLQKNVAKFQKEFGWRTQIEKVEKFYERVIKEKRLKTQ